MKTLSRLVIALVTLLVVVSYVVRLESSAFSGEANVADLPVSNVSIREKNIHLVLSKISHQYQVPIGLEVSPDDDLLKEGNIAVQINTGALRDVLDSIVNQSPLYVWNVEDNVICVYPREQHRDAGTKALLETELRNFVVEEGTSRFKFRETLMRSPEFKIKLEANGIMPDNEIFSSRDVAILGRGFSLNSSNATVKSILNQVVKKSETKYWIINREGANKQYLLLNLMARVSKD